MNEFYGYENENETSHPISEESSVQEGPDTTDATVPPENTAAPDAEHRPLSEGAEELGEICGAPVGARVWYTAAGDEADKLAGQTLSSPLYEQKKRKPSVLKGIAGCVAMALIFGIVSAATFLGLTGLPGNTDGNVMAGDTADSGTEVRSAVEIMAEALKAAGVTVEDELTIPQINIIMQPTMVAINCYKETTINQGFFGSQTYQSTSAGSGIIVGENETELLIVTNNHVVDDADEIEVVLVDGKTYPAYIKGTDATNDLAVIVVKRADLTEDSMNAIAHAELGDSDALVVGEDVVAIGNALGYGQSVTSGIVSALNRAVTDTNNNTTYLIQTDAAVNPGNSGGALVNRRGEVIGINSAKYSDEAVEGMCFAIPINTALPILEELMLRETREEVTDPAKRAYLGITPQDVTSAMASAYNMPIGVYVTSVYEDTAAEKAGMYAGDIITRFDKETVSSLSALQKLLSYYEAGETVEIVVQRYERGKYTEVTLTVTLDVYPADEGNS